MKKRSLFCRSLILSLLLYPSSDAWSAPFTGQIPLRGNSMSLLEVVREIEETTDYSFFYKSSDLEGSAKKNYNLNGDIEKVLSEVFEGSGIVYKVNGKEIILSKASAKSVKQQRTISGVVTDATDGSTVIGANVVVKGTTNGVITDLDGNFSLTFSGKSCTLEVSYVGYKKQEVYITDQGLVNVKLVPDNEMLAEVVVVGQGTQKKVSVTGSIATVKGSTLKVPSSSLTSSLAGKLAGIMSMTSSGEPGSSSEFYIRGINTFGGRSTPLILLDGVEISSSDLNRIPAESIESFSLLKDASATAIYGNRGANGVMLVTTKSGTENSKAKINVSLEASYFRPMNVVEFADGPTFMRTYNEAAQARSLTPITNPKYTEEQILNTEKGLNPYVYPNVDWYDLIFKEGNYNQRANINLQGGGSRVTYYKF